MHSSVRPRAIAGRLCVESLENRRLLASITGSVYADANYNARRDGNEPIATNATAFIDANDNRTLDAGELTSPVNGNGGYTFADLAAGTYRVRLAVPAGFQMTTPGIAGVEVTSDAPDTYFVGPVFGVAATPADGSISGYAFRDEDRSGTPTSGDIFGGTTFGPVFIDANDNAVRDSGEIFATVDSNTGRFSFSGLPDGTYTVRASGGSLGLVAPATQTYQVTLGVLSPNTPPAWRSHSSNPAAA